jgi:hypothetical protein
MAIRKLVAAVRGSAVWLLVLAGLLQGAGLGLPELGKKPNNAVPFETVREVALNRVNSLWRAVAMGPVIPYQDYDGATVAYMFHFRVDGKPFPADFEQAVSEDRADIDGFQNAEHVAPPSGKFRYAHVLVSARADRTPVITWGEGLTEFYRTGRKAQSQAAGVLAAASPVLRRMYFTWPVTYFVFEAGRSIVMHANLVTQVRSDADYVAACRADEAERKVELAVRLAPKGKTVEGLEAELRQRCDREWDRALNPQQDLPAVYVPDYQKAPFYDWSFGCSPTSGAMIFGWLDNVCHHGRLIDWHYQRWDTVELDVDYNVANAQLELAVAMGTDSMTGSTHGSNIGPGLYDAVARYNNYSATWGRWYYYETSNWCWDEITSVINAGCPVEWSVHPVHDGGHSLACFGYDQSNGFLYVHNTWDPPGEWWHYTAGGTFDVTQADYVSPDVQPNTYVKLFYPRPDTLYNSNGHGVKLHAWEQIPVILTATAGDSWKLYFSGEGGVPGSWMLSTSGTGHPTTVYTDLTSANASDAARFRIVIYTAGQDAPYAASDGSWSNFRIVNEVPPAPILIWPYNNGYIRSKFPTLHPPLYLNRISYAWQYWFRFYNDSLGDTVESGWQADTICYVSTVCPVGSHGWWQAKARNPTGEGPWSGRNSYSIVLDTSKWMAKRKPQMLTKKKPKKGGCVMHKKKKKYADLVASDDTLYLLVGNNTREFLRYSVWNDEWSHACSLSAGPNRKRAKGGAMLLSDTSFCYAFKGGGTNEFCRYDPGVDAWTELAGPNFAKGIKNGYAALAEVAGRDYIYLGSGAANNEWQRYDVAAGVWEPLAAVPVAKTKAGSSICWDGDQLIYLLAGGNKENLFYSLRPDLGTWTPLASLPFAGPTGKKKKAKEGAGIEFFQGKVYAVKGGNTREFWGYDPGLNQWSYKGEVGQGLGSPPVKGIKCAKPLAATDDGIYCIFGNNTDEFFFWAGDTTHGAMAWQPGDGIALSKAFGARPAGLSINPNPCSRTAMIAYSVPGPGYVSLKLYDVTGKLVRTLADGYRTAGEYGSPLTANGLRLSAGIYLLKYEAGDYRATEKLVIE